MCHYKIMLWRSVLCLLVVQLVTVLADEEQEKVVKTANGAVRGYLSEESGVYEFLDIPYATAPTGSNKFKAPLPPPTWNGIVDAVDTGVICPQLYYSKLNGNKTMDENCLLARVFVPDTTQKRLPVVVYFLGGSFQFEFRSWINPTYLVKEYNIIAVTFNYRLGAHGFLCLGTEDIPGNAGMKDQIALMNWVRQNIAIFGGNPNDVTLAGSYAGGASVDLMVLSKLARGLFNKIIADSGALLAPNAMQTNPLENAKQFAINLKFENTDDIDALEQFYKTLPYKLLSTGAGFSRTFSPCVERTLDNFSEVFLDEKPMEILEKGDYTKVPSLYGFASLKDVWTTQLLKYWKNRMKKKFSDFLPENLIFDSKEEKEKVAEKIKEFYFGNDTVDKNNLISYAYYFTDVLAAYPIINSVNAQVKNGNDRVYLYEFKYVDEQTPAISLFRKGGEQSGQTVTIMAPFGKHRRMAKKYDKMSSKIQQIWANFIKTGKPVPEESPLSEWPAVKSQASPYMSLGNEFILIDAPLLEERMALWDAIYEEHYREPLPPPQYDNTDLDA